MDTPPLLDFAALSRADLEGVGLGVSSEVFRIRNTNIVAKVPAVSPFFPQDLHENEKAAYDRIGRHPHILRCLGQSPPSCKLLKCALLFEYHPRGSVSDCIKEIPSLPMDRRRLSVLSHTHPPLTFDPASSHLIQTTIPGSKFSGIRSLSGHRPWRLRPA